MTFRPMLAVLAAIFVGEAALGCTMPPPKEPPLEISCAGEIHGRHYLQVALRDYTTFAEQSGFCSCALNLPEELGEVVNAQIVYAGTSIPLPGFNFSPSEGAAEFPDGDFQGFSSQVFGAINSGERVDILFFVASEQNVCKEVADFYTNEAKVVAGTDAADAEGVPLGKHMGLFKRTEVSLTEFKECRAPRG